MKKTLLIVALVSALPIAPLQAEWRDYVPSVPFWNNAVSEDKENVALTEKEQLIQSAKKYACTGAALLALYVVLSQESSLKFVSNCAEEGLLKLHNALCTITRNEDARIKHLIFNTILSDIHFELGQTYISIEQLSKVASLVCFGKAGYDLIRAPFAQSDSARETINS